MDSSRGLARNRKKRKFGEDESTETAAPLPSSTSDDFDAADTNFRDYAQNLIQQAQVSQQEDTNDDLSVSPPIPEPIPAAASLSTSRSSGKTQIKLKDLFNYSLNRTAGEGLEFYWPGSIKNLEDDLRAHERAAAEFTPAT